MSGSLKSFTFKDVAKHNTREDLYFVVHDRVYNASKFIDSHPGGEEVMLDNAGQDVSEAYEDVGHSDEAREILETLRIGNLKRLPGEGPQRTAPTRHPFVPRDFSGMPGGIRIGGAVAGTLLASAIVYLGYIYAS